MRFLVVEDQDEIREIILMTLESVFPESIIHHSATVQDAQTLISSISGEYDLIVCDYNLLDGLGIEVFKYLRETLKLNTPFIFQTSVKLEEIIKPSDFFLENSKNEYLKKPYFPKELETKIFSIINPSKLKREQELPALIKISSHFFVRYNKSLADIYKLNNINEYEIFIPKGKNYTTTEINSCIESGINFLYIKKTDYLSFGMEHPHLSFLINESSYSSPLKTWESSLEVAKGLMSSYGISTSVIHTATSAINVLKSKLVELPTQSTSEIFSQFQGHDNYLADHSFMTAILCCAITKEVPWGNRETYRETFAYASLFHDLALSHELVKAELIGNNLLDFNSSDRKKFGQHPFGVSSILHSIPLFSGDVEQIILEHHERPDGTGFPRGLNATTIHPLSCIFIVAHDIVRMIYLSGFDSEFLPKIFDSIKETYSSGHFKTIIKDIDKIFNLNQSNSSRLA